MDGINESGSTEWLKQSVTQDELERAARDFQRIVEMADSFPELTGRINAIRTLLMAAAVEFAKGEKAKSTECYMEMKKQCAALVCGEAA